MLKVGLQPPVAGAVGVSGSPSGGRTGHEFTEGGVSGEMYWTVSMLAFALRQLPVACVVEKLVLVS
jgi:hypothetical protein